MAYLQSNFADFEKPSLVSTHMSRRLVRPEFGPHASPISAGFSVGTLDAGAKKGQGE
jgi:hypothetical protein